MLENKRKILQIAASHCDLTGIIARLKAETDSLKSKDFVLGSILVRKIGWNGVAIQYNGTFVKNVWNCNTYNNIYREKDPPDFGRSVNPISTRGDKLCPPNYYWHPGFLDLPTTHSTMKCIVKRMSNSREFQDYF